MDEQSKVGQGRVEQGGAQGRLTLFKPPRDMAGPRCIRTAVGLQNCEEKAGPC